LKTIPIILISYVLLSGCSSKPVDKSAAKADAPSDAPGKAPVPVKVMTLSKTRISRTIDYTSTILPYEEVNMVPSAPGRIEKIYVEVGDRVNKGTDLFLMDRTQLYQQKVQLANIAKDLSRLDTLLRSGSAKQQQYDQMKTQYDVTSTNVDFMEANTLLKAPFDGVITGKYFEDGEMYSGTPTTQSGRSAVVTIMQVNPLKVNVNITEQYYPLIRKGMNADITADVYKEESFRGTVSLKAPTIDPNSRSFITEIELPNRNDLLKPGMFVRVSMDLGEVDTFVAPASSVMIQEGTNIRYLFIADGEVARRVEVELGKRFDDQLEIISGTIKEGVSIVTEGQSRLIDNDKIKIVK
jgi:RND family efflux transporter MFP subunit